VAKSTQNSIGCQFVDLSTIGDRLGWNNFSGRDPYRGRLVVAEDASWQLDVTVSGGAVWLSPQGDLDMETSPVLIREAQREFAAGAKRVVVNLSGVTFVDSSGIGALVTLWRTIGETPGSFAIASPSKAAQSVLATTGIDGLLERADAEPFTPQR
jgi:anti-anti-sigma factor